ncbi:hypothetical protein GQ43DRAFT_428779 [Delitschia confertaspora ATCC 74209]|uniref:Transmembrane protein n=1 Tax=Delitschia confertaspora ATCC 74209 TaxID=1513339 RepID=A0A9P4MVH5_9PLEO|nr:hypothetical protein GQ43DRAFT_428779 [Delitschia confertaspora ATCC 74209]
MGGRTVMSPLKLPHPISPISHDAQQQLCTSTQTSQPSSRLMQPLPPSYFPSEDTLRDQSRTHVPVPIPTLIPLTPPPYAILPSSTPAANITPPYTILPPTAPLFAAPSISTLSSTSSVTYVDNDSEMGARNRGLSTPLKNQRKRQHIWIAIVFAIVVVITGVVAVVLGTRHKREEDSWRWKTGNVIGSVPRSPEYGVGERAVVSGTSWSEARDSIATRTVEVTTRFVRARARAKVWERQVGYTPEPEPPHSPEELKKIQRDSDIVIGVVAPFWLLLILGVVGWRWWYVKKRDKAEEEEYMVARALAEDRGGERREANTWLRRAS